MSGIATMNQQIRLLAVKILFLGSFFCTGALFPHSSVIATETLFAMSPPPVDIDIDCRTILIRYRAFFRNKFIDCD